MMLNAGLKASYEVWVKVTDRIHNAIRRTKLDGEPHMVHGLFYSLQFDEHQCPKITTLLGCKTKSEKFELQKTE